MTRSDWVRELLEASGTEGERLPPGLTNGISLEAQTEPLYDFTQSRKLCCSPFKVTHRVVLKTSNNVFFSPKLFKTTQIQCKWTDNTVEILNMLLKFSTNRLWQFQLLLNFSNIFRSKDAASEKYTYFTEKVCEIIANERQGFLKGHNLYWVLVNGKHCKIPVSSCFASFQSSQELTSWFSETFWRPV